MKASALAQRRGSRAKQAWLALLLAGTACLEAAPPVARAQARRAPTGGSTAASTPAPAADGLQLRVRRLPDAVELVLAEAGLGASLTQQSLGNQWLGELRTDRARTLKVGPQSVTLPADGMERISFEGSGTSFRLTVTAEAGRTLPQPVVSSDGRDLIVRFPAAPNVLAQTARPNLRQPSPVPTAANVPPLRPRAVAPPVGDMAVGTMTLRNRGAIKLSGPPVTLTTRGANARDVLMVLAQMGGYGFAFSESIATQQKETREGSSINNRTETREVERKLGFIPPVTVSFKNELYERAFNLVLLSSGLQARKEGNTIMVGENILSKTIGAQVSKVYRLNQVSSNSAADYLANLGATVTKTNTTLTSITTGGDQSQPSGAPNQATTTTGSETRIEAFGASTGPLVGLLATTDSRLSTITLVGEGDVVTIAEQYLKQLDLRQRQVALSLRILDVNLDNDKTIDNSFAIRWGNNFIVNDNGQLLGIFGNNLPPAYSQPPSFAPGFSTPYTSSGASFPEPNPGLAYPKDQFYDFLRAQIVSQSTKLLASPTLILQENPSLLREGKETAEDDSSSGGGQEVSQGISNIGLSAPIGRRRANEGVVRVGTNVVTNYRTTETQGAIACVPVLSTSGLVLGARVEKIDDNGFVTFVLSPSISAITDQQPAPAGCGAPLNILSIRSLDTGALRVRDGQTLIMTGVISDFDRAEVSKWPILGDIPLIGSFFRSSGTRREKRELVIMVTPKIINDEQGGAYGYGYLPSTQDARQLLYGDNTR